MSAPIKELSVPDLQRFIPVVHSVSDQDPQLNLALKSKITKIVLIKPL